MNHYYADFMADYLQVPRNRIHVIPHGLQLAGHGSRQPSPDGAQTVGYLARICPEKGLHLLVEAFEQLFEDCDLPPLKLRIAGYLGDLDKPYFKAIQQRVKTWRRPERFEYLGEVDRAAKIAFLQSLNVLSVPTVYRESKGISSLEAMANAVPVVLPAHGVFPELVADTGGGLLHEPNDPSALAASLRRVLEDPELALSLGQSGQQAIRDRYHAAAMAEKTASLYHTMLETHRMPTEACPTFPHA
jgi:glycosyltransferase involved in cell wall biosynthesis